jgi:hypothetical protein
MAQEAVNALSNFITPTFIIAILGLSFLFLYFAFKLKDQHFFLQFFLIMMALVTMQVLPNTLTNDLCLITGHQVNVSGQGFSLMECYQLETNTALSMLRIVQNTFYFFIAYMSVFVVYNHFESVKAFFRRHF